MAVESAWIDFNGHLNLAYYHVLFDRAADEVSAALGLGLAYVEEGRGSTFALEAHVRYLREVKREDPVLVETVLVAHDEKRLLFFQSLLEADSGRLFATNEVLSIHVDMTTRRAAPFPPDRLAAIAALAAAHAGLPRSDRLGRGIALKG
jgi:acyl-CoA thioester hydrolase